MSTTGSYHLPVSEQAVQAEIKRLASQARLGWEKEARALAWFGLHDGMAVLEPGSGPGFITEQLMALLPSSPITCVEINPTLLDEARCGVEQILARTPALVRAARGFRVHRLNPAAVVGERRRGRSRHFRA